VIRSYNQEAAHGLRYAPPVRPYDVMREKMIKMMEILKKPAAILSTFILFKGTQTVYVFATGERPGRLPTLHLLTFVVMAAVSFFAIRGKKTAEWIMGLYLLAQIITVFWAVFLIPAEQLLLKVTAIILSTYFVYGGWIILKIAKGKS